MVRHSGYATRARGPRQSAETVADAIARAIEHPVPEVYPYRMSQGAGDAQRDCARPLRSDRETVGTEADRMKKNLHHGGREDTEPLMA